MDLRTDGAGDRTVPELAAGSPPATGSLHHDRLGVAPIGQRALARLVDFAIGLLLFGGLVAWVTTAAGPSPDGTGVVFVAIAATFLVYLVYEVVFVAVWGRTLGKALMGIKVVRDRDGVRPGLWRSFLRNLVPTLLLIGFFPLYPLPYIVATIVPDHRWPHDRLAGTRVVVRGL